MPWCPKCRTEYRAGFTKCFDCGSELVAEEPAEEAKVPAWMEDMPEEYKKAAMEQADAPKPSAEQIAAAQMQMQQMAAEAGKQQAQAPRRQAGPRYLYQDSSTKANDNKSSAWTLLIVGFAGLIAMGLGIAGILPIPFGSSPLFYGVMVAMFLLFIVGGFVSMKNAKVLTKQADVESQKRNEMIQWMKDNFDAAKIDAIIHAEEEPEEMVYFKRISFMKYALDQQFPYQDQGFLDNLIDEYLYDSFFEE